MPRGWKGGTLARHKASIRYLFAPVSENIYLFAPWLKRLQVGSIPDFTNSEIPDFAISGFLHFLKPLFLKIMISGIPKVLISGFLKILISGFHDSVVFGFITVATCSKPIILQPLEKPTCEIIHS